jgi:signal transduction histidine kinase
LGELLINSAPATKESATAILEMIGLGLGWDAGILWVGREGDSRLRPLGSWKTGVPAEALTAETVWRSRQPLWIENRSQGPYPHDEPAPEFESGFYFPVRGQRGAHGVIELRGRAPRAVNFNSFRTAAVIGNQVGQYFDREMAEADHQATRQHIRDLLDGTKDRDFFLVDESGVLRSWTQTAAALTGLNADRAVGQPWDAVLRPDAGVEPLAVADRSGWARYRTDARGASALVEVRAFFDGEGKRAGYGFYVGSSRDAAPARLVEADLSSELRGMAILNHLSTRLVSTVDLTTVLSEALLGLCELAGAQAASVLLCAPDQLQVATVLGLGLAPALVREFKGALQKSHPCDVPLHERRSVWSSDPGAAPRAADLARRGGHRVMWSVPLLGRGPEPLGAVCLFFRSDRLFSDSAHHRVDLYTRLVSQVIDNAVLYAKAQQQISRRLHTERRLERSNTELAQFTYITSHDLQEPLRQVSNFSQLLQRRNRGCIDERTNSYLNHIVDNVDRMHRQIQDLLLFSRLGREAPARDAVDLNALLSDLVAESHRSLVNAGATVSWDSLPTITGDRDLLQLAFTQLISNALKFRGPFAPHIRVSARQAAGHWEILVADNGIGIEPRYGRRIFRVFARLHSRRDYPGTGIGLAIVKKIMDLHNGQIAVDSQLGAGSVFHLTFPTA